MSEPWRPLDALVRHLGLGLQPRPRALAEAAWLRVCMFSEADRRVSLSPVETVATATPSPADPSAPQPSSTTEVGAQDDAATPASPDADPDRFLSEPRQATARPRARPRLRTRTDAEPSGRELEWGRGSAADEGGRAERPMSPLDQDVGLGPLNFLRRFHRISVRRPVAGRWRVDVPATVRLTAESAGVLRLARRPVVRASTGLILLLDGAASLAPWRELLRRLRASLTEMGSFTSVTAVEVDLSRPDAVRLHELDAGDGRRLELAGLKSVVRPGNDHVLLLVTDGLGAAVESGALGAELESLPMGVVIAWLHPWPKFAWVRSGLGRLASVATAEPRADLTIPVVALSPDGLGQVADLAHGRAARDARRWVVPTEPSSGRRPQPPRWSGERQLGGLARLLPVPSLRLLALSASVPGAVDVELLDELAYRFGTSGSAEMKRWYLGAALASGVMERVGERAFQVKASVRSEVRFWTAASDLREILQFVADRFEHDDAGAKRLGIPVALIRHVLDPDSPVDPDRVEAEIARGGVPQLERLVRDSGGSVDVARLRRRARIDAAGQEVRRRAPVVGEPATGVVVGVGRQGAYVDLGGTIGLLAPGRVRGTGGRPLDAVLSEDHSIEVTVEAVDRSTGRVWLSAELDAEAREFVRRFAIGRQVRAKVVAVEDTTARVLVGGAHAELPAALRQSRNLAPGDPVLARVRRVHAPTQWLSLTQVARMPEGWEIGTVVAGTVRHRHEGGWRVALMDGTAAFLPSEETAWELGSGESVDAIVTGHTNAGTLLVSHRRACKERWAAQSRRMAVGDAVSGPLVRTGSRDAVVDVAGVPGVLRCEGELGEVGTVIEAWICAIDGASGVLRLSREVIPMGGWSGRHPAIDDPMPGVVRAHVHGGALVEARGFLAFLAAEQGAWEQPTHLEVLFPVGARVDAMVLSVDARSRRIELSRLPFVVNPLRSAPFREGDRVNGRVSHVWSDGAYVDVVRVRTFLPAWLVDWSPAPDPRTKLRVGDEVRVLVRRIDVVSRVVEVDLRKLSPDPLRAWWGSTDRSEPVVVEVTGLRGLDPVVELAPGILGVLEAEVVVVSEEGARPARKGDLLEVVIDWVDYEERLVHLVESPSSRAFADFARTHVLGERVVGRVSAVYPFGAFVEVDGFSTLLPASLVARREYGRAADLPRTGERIEAVVQTINYREGKVALNRRPLLPPLRGDLLAAFPEGKEVRGVVEQVLPDALIVDLGELNAKLHRSYMVPRPPLGPLPFARGDAIQAIVSEVDSEGGMKLRQAPVPGVTLHVLMRALHLPEGIAKRAAVMALGKERAKHFNAPLSAAEVAEVRRALSSVDAGVEAASSVHGPEPRGPGQVVVHPGRSLWVISSRNGVKRDRLDDLVARVLRRSVEWDEPLTDGDVDQVLSALAEEDQRQLSAALATEPRAVVSGERFSLGMEGGAALSSAEQFLGAFPSGSRVHGSIEGLLDYGAIVVVDGTKGLLHWSKMSRGPLRMPNKVFRSGERVEVIVDASSSPDKVAFSQMQLLPSLSRDIARRYRPGTRVSGRVAYRTGTLLVFDLGEVHGTVLRDGSADVPWPRKGAMVDATVLSFDEASGCCQLALIDPRAPK